MPHRYVDGKRGIVRSFNVPSPSAGTEWVIAVPHGKVWHVITIFMIFVTSAAVATRRVAMDFKTGGNLFATVVSVEPQAASTTNNYMFAENITRATVLHSRAITPIPQNQIMYEGETVGSATLVIDAADQFSAIVLRVEEWDV